MNDNYFDSEEYTKIDFTKTNIKKGEYDNCTFVNCDFQSIHVSNIQFLECKFIDCNFSNATIKETSFKEVNFINCKMIGLKFNEVHPFLLQMSFEKCQLNFSSFYQLKIQNTKFISCNLEEVDFTETLATDCIFENSNLQKSDFRMALNFNINPEINRLKGAKFSSQNLFGLLSAYKIIIE
jgi:uncharacterized protein YjbI with pentapeptide repeats